MANDKLSSLAPSLVLPEAQRLATAGCVCQALPVNQHGRDWFIGDIHGYFDRVHDTLHAQGFNPQHDRLICAGDLIDRGLESLQAINWLRQPFFFSVQGNHDVYLDERLRRLAITLDDERVYKEGGGWLRDADRNTAITLAHVLMRLPHVLIVPQRDGRVIGVVHAEFPDTMTWPSLLTHTWTPSDLNGLIWGRKRVRSLMGKQEAPQDKHTIAGLDAVICGHSTFPFPIKVGNIVYLDTGGWRPKGQFYVLTAAEIHDLPVHPMTEEGRMMRPVAPDVLVQATAA